MRRILLISFALFICACSAKNESMFNNQIQKEAVLKASKNYNKLISEYKEKLKKDNQEKTRYELSLLYYEIGDYNNALYYLEPIIYKGKNIDAFMLKAVILEKMEESNKALNIINLVLSIEPNNAKAWNLKGVIFARNHSYDEAKICFLRAKEYYLDDLQVDANLGILETINENYSQALNYFKPLYIRNYKDERFLNSFVLALIKNKESELAEQIYNNEGLGNNFDAVKIAINNLSFKHDN